jgi:hypothetical protein
VAQYFLFVSFNSFDIAGFVFSIALSIALTNCLASNLAFEFEDDQAIF